MSIQRTARAIGTLVFAIIFAVSGSAVTNAATITRPAGSITPHSIGTCTAGNGWGGNFYCDSNDSSHGQLWYQFPDGTWQVFVVAGSDWTVWTRWNHTDGSLSAWTNYFAGGSPNYGYVQHGKPFVDIVGSSGRELTIEVTGTDGHLWADTRSSDGSWSGWYRI